MRKRRIDPTFIALSLITLVTIGIVATFLLFTSIVSQDDARIYPATPTPPPYFSTQYPAPVPTSAAAVLGPALDPRPAAVSKTVEGITIIVQPRYADLHRVVLTYTISGPTQPYQYSVGFDPNIYNWPTLSLDDGTNLPSNRLNLYETPYSDIVSTQAGQPIYGEGLLSYDISGLPSLPSTLSLHLNMPVILNNTPYTIYTPIPTFDPKVNATNTPSLPYLQTQPPVSVLTFDFDLSTQTDNRCRQVQPALTAEKSGVKMTLDSVSVTASEVRARLSFSGKYNNQTVSSGAAVGLGNNWVASGTMDTGPGTKQFKLWDDCDLNPCSPWTGFHYRASSLIDAPQPQWLLKVDSLYFSRMGEPIPGPWIFKFDMPPASPCAALPTPLPTSTP